MKSDPRSSCRLAACGLVMVAAGSMVSPTLAQEGSPSVETTKDATADPSTSIAEAPAVSQSERLLRLEGVIEADKKKIVEIREDFAKRESLFDLLVAGRETREAEVAEKTKRLEEMGGPAASEAAAALAAEIQSDQELIVAAKRQSEITFQSLKALQDQIQALEEKIEGEEQARKDMVGPLAAELTAEAEPATEVPAPETTAAPGLTPGQLLMPGVGTAPTAAPERSAPTQPSTAEQIAARQQADRAEEDARRAEAAVVSFVERKTALESQIEVEEKLIETAGESRGNLDAALATAKAEVERLMAADAGKSALQSAQETVQVIEDLQRENRDEIDQRRAYRDSLRERLDRLLEEQIVVTQEAEARRLEAEAARKRTVWLESPLHPVNLWRWISTRGPRMVLVVVVTWALLMLVRLTARGVARTAVGKRRTERSRGVNRADTLALSFRSAISLFIVLAGVLLVFQEAGVDVKTILGGAAILGVALAFGAQNLMRDYFTGFMILLEDQYELGDLITVSGITGTVEKVNMRTTVLRDLEGRVHFIPNGDIKAVTNRTYVWGRAVVEVAIGYKEDVDRAMAVILEVAEEFRADPEVGDWVTDDPVMLGVDRFTDQGVMIKFMVQTKPDKIFPTRRELLRRVKNKFDAEGIRLSVPHRILIQESDEGVGL